DAAENRTNQSCCRRPNFGMALAVILAIRLRIRGPLQARRPSRGGRNCSNPLWSNGFFTRICPTNSGQCSIEHLSIVRTQQRKVPQERSCLTDSVPRRGQLLSPSLPR